MPAFATNRRRLRLAVRLQGGGCNRTFLVFRSQYNSTYPVGLYSPAVAISARRNFSNRLGSHANTAAELATCSGPTPRISLRIRT
jgi:hypothetical protein